MRKLFLLLVLMSFASSFIMAQPPGTASLTIGWSVSDVYVETNSSGNQAFVRLDWNDGAAGQNYGVWSWQFEITLPSAITTFSVALHSSISSNFNISTSYSTNSVRVAIYGKAPNRMLKDNNTSSASYLVLTLTFTAPSSDGDYTITLTNLNPAVVRLANSPYTPYNINVSNSSSTLNVHATTTPTDNVPTFSEPDPPYGSSPRKYGDINWDGSINVADVTGLADVVIGKYSAVTVNDPITSSRDFFGSGGPGFQSGNTADINDRKAADVYGSTGSPDNTLDLMDLATLEDAVTNGAWPSYAISAIANKPAYKINGGPGIGSGILAKVEGSGARSEKVATDVFVKFEVFNSGQKGSKIRVTVDNNSAELRGLQIELASSVLPGKLDVWGLPDASGLKVAWKRNDFNKIVILVYADGGKVMKSGSASYVTIVVPNVTREQILGAEPKVIASIKNISYDVNYDVTEASGIVPLNYMLYQNYPNPFNPGTKIEFEVPEYSNVKLIIWNSLGQKVKEIYSGAVDPNRYSVYWDGKDENGLSVASGIYFVTMYARSLEEQGREFTMTRKMILMK
jgi:hypothetical protein